MSGGETGTALTASETVAEAIAAKDLNNLYLTSCYFRDLEKYRAFCSLYALMRVVDDRIDELIPRGELSPAEREHEHEVARAWERAFDARVAGGSPDAGTVRYCERSDAAELLEAAGDAMARFPLPQVLWRNFFAAMHRDVDQRPFDTFRDFLDYTEGASVAPTTIYLYLIAAEARADGRYTAPAGFDLIGAGRHLGTFAYLAHVLRDLSKDLAAGENGLLYLAQEDLERHGLTLAALQEDRANRRARPALRALVEEIAGRARREQDAGTRIAAALAGRLTPDCDFILRLIVRIYERALDKLAAADFDPLVGEHRLTLADKHRIAREVAEPLGFSLVPAVAAPWSRASD